VREIQQHVRKRRTITHVLDVGASSCCAALHHLDSTVCIAETPRLPVYIMLFAFPQIQLSTLQEAAGVPPVLQPAPSPP
jgi:hypothetical protein